MNPRIRELWDEAAKLEPDPSWQGQTRFMEKFAELIVEECRRVVTEVYRKTPLELCGPLLTVDEEIAKHFYVVDGMSTEDKKTLIKELLGVKND